MNESLQAIRGMDDLTPEVTPLWSYVEAQCRSIVNAYGYEEIRFPLLEKTALFKRTIGEVTDIVEKEMYTFEDRNGDSLSLRPEGTAGCIRACIEKGLIYNQVRKLWYLGPMFRHERPQKGRCRQFHQVGVEVFGIAGPEIEAEMILMTHRLWKQLGIEKEVTLEINSLGSAESRARYREALVNYFHKHLDQLDEDSQRRLLTNPLRILDSKNEAMRGLIQAAPQLTNYLDEASRTHFDRLCILLKDTGIHYAINPRLVRGLDYYGLTVFEWVTNQLGAQGTICGGGRYDILVERLGGKSTPGVGFALGLERLVALVQDKINISSSMDVFVVLSEDFRAQQQGLKIVEQLHSLLPHWRCWVNVGGGNFKTQFKRADKSGARWALVIAEEELNSNTVTLKSLREESAQMRYSVEEVIAFFKRVDHERTSNRTRTN